MDEDLLFDVCKVTLFDLEGQLKCFPERNIVRDIDNIHGSPIETERREI